MDTRVHSLLFLFCVLMGFVENTTYLYHQFYLRRLSQIKSDTINTHTCVRLAGGLVRGVTIRYLSTDKAARLKISTPTVTEVMNPRRTQVPPPSCQFWKLALRSTQGKVSSAPRSARLRLRSRTELGLERLRGFLTSTSHNRR